YERSGHLFQGRYKGILIEKDSYLVPLSRYVHLNSVRAGLVRRPEDYRWGSYRGYIGRERGFGWMEYGWVLSQFGQERKRARRRYQRYVEEGLEVKGNPPFKNLYGQVILGGEGFIERIKGMLRGIPISQEIVERKRFLEFPSSTEVVRVVSKIFGVKQEDIWDRRKNKDKAREVAIYFCKQYTGLSNEVIGKQFGGIHYSAVSKVANRVREEVLRNRKLSELVDQVISHFKA
ncbi:MAG: helix-turn-helix domain-containing protein, partial [Thermodesulfobacteriota bacterium]